MIKFDQGSYTNIFNKRISKGEVYVEIEDKRKNTLVYIYEKNKLKLEKGRYCLIYHFQNASGRLTLK